jgi:hypothetical protein
MSGNLKIKIQKTILFPVFENGVLRRIFESKRDEM